MKRELNKILTGLVVLVGAALLMGSVAAPVMLIRSGASPLWVTIPTCIPAIVLLAWMIGDLA
jgi:hypothetical protein